MSLRVKIFVAFLLVAGAMGAETVLAIRSMHQQAAAADAALHQAERASSALASLRALPGETEGLVLAHLAAEDAATKAAFEGDLLAATTREMLALAQLKDLAQGAQVELVADLSAQADAASGLRDQILAISDRNALGHARTLATEAMPGLRAEVLATLEDIAAQGSQDLAAERAGKALNAIAAAQKNAILGAEADFIATQFQDIALAEEDLAAAIALIEGEPVPALVPLRDLMASLARLDDEMEAVLRDTGTAKAMALFEGQLQGLDHQRIEAVDGLAALYETALRSSADRAKAAIAARQALLVVGADLALVLGFVLLAIGLGRIGRGLEGAVRLAERMASEEGASALPARGTLAGRLTSALTRISAGQGAVLAGLEAVAAGRAMRPDVPARFRDRLNRIARPPAAAPAAAPSDEGTRLREGTLALRGLAHGSVQEAKLLQAEAERVVTLLPDPGPPREALLRHALQLDRHLAHLIEARQQLDRLAEGQVPPWPLRQSA